MKKMCGCINENESIHVHVAICFIDKDPLKKLGTFMFNRYCRCVGHIAKQ